MTRKNNRPRGVFFSGSRRSRVVPVRHRKVPEGSVRTCCKTRLYLSVKDPLLQRGGVLLRWGQKVPMMAKRERWETVGGQSPQVNHRR